MPRLPMDYSKTIIYKIVCNDLNIKDCYVGSTTDFISRKSQHKCNCINEKSKGYNYRVYQFIRETGGWCNWSMIEIEKFPCNDKNESLARERYWIELLNATLNKHLPTRTKQEWCEDNKEKNSEKKKEYWNKNRDELLEKKKEYYETHKEEISEKGKIYRENNKEEIREKKSLKVECECGCYISNCHIARHRNSPKHKQLLELKL